MLKGWCTGAEAGSGCFLEESHSQQVLDCHSCTIELQDEFKQSCVDLLLGLMPQTAQAITPVEQKQLPELRALALPGPNYESHHIGGSEML